jgi:hypothetical protein
MKFGTRGVFLKLAYAFQWTHFTTYIHFCAWKLLDGGSPRRESPGGEFPVWNSQSAAEPCWGILRDNAITKPDSRWVLLFSPTDSQHLSTIYADFYLLTRWGQSLECRSRRAGSAPLQLLWAPYPILTEGGRVAAWGLSSAGAGRESLGVLAQMAADEVVRGLSSRGRAAGVQRSHLVHSVGTGHL